MCVYLKTGDFKAVLLLEMIQEIGESGMQKGGAKQSNEVLEKDCTSRTQGLRLKMKIKGLPSL